MKLRTLSALALVATLALYGPALAQRTRTMCGPHGCKTISVLDTPLPSQGVRWVTHDSDPDRSYLYQGNTMLGAWDHPGKYWRAVGPRGWGAFEKTAPVPAPFHAEHAAEAPVGDTKCYFGVTAGGLTHGESVVTCRGERIRDAYEAIAGAPGQLTDDSAKARVSYIDADAKARDQFVKDFKTAPAYAEVRDKALAWEGAPDDWSYEPGFDTSGKPGVIVQAASGQVLHSQRSGPAASPGVMAAIRQPVPGYDKTKDPDLNTKPALPALGKIDSTTVLTGAIMAASVFFFRKR